MDHTDEMAALESPLMGDFAPFPLAAGRLAAVTVSDLGDGATRSQFRYENAAHRATTDDTLPHAFGQTHSVAAEQMTAAVTTAPTRRPLKPSVDQQPSTAAVARETSLACRLHPSKPPLGVFAVLQRLSLISLSLRRMHRAGRVV